jgi:bacillithiol biosynthesis cysteine-adding enzyme BshC
MAKGHDLQVLDLEKIYHNDLLIDYLANKEKITNFLKKKNLTFAKTEFTGDRQLLREILLQYNKSIDAPENVIEKIEQIEDKKIKFVVTGQQPGFLTGPLYTIYKTLAAINYAERYSTEDMTLLPLFWNASEDHDVAEVNNIQILNREKDVVPFTIQDESYFGKSLEKLPLDKKKFVKKITEMRETIIDTEFSAKIFDGIILKELDKATYWGEFFSRLMTRLLGNFGLIIVEPYIFRPYLQDFFMKLIDNTKKYNKIFLSTTEQLQKLGYEPKMHKKEEVVGLFYIDEENNRNNIILGEDDKYHISNGSIFSKKEVEDLIAKYPERFSTNAILRPIAQDLMIPTHLFVGGPSEIGYHIQIKDLYPEFNLIQPNLLFRMGGTIIERHVDKVFKKYDFTIYDLRDVNKLMNRLVGRKKEDIVPRYKKQVADTLEELNQRLRKFNPELASRAKGKKINIMREMDEIEKMHLQYLKKDDEIMKRQLDKAQSYIFPNNKPQERVLNIVQYINKYSLDLLYCMKDLLNEVEPGNHVVMKCWML